MHAADLVGVQRLREEVDGRHLTAEDALLIGLVGGADVTLVERLSAGAARSGLRASGASKYRTGLDLAARSGLRASWASKYRTGLGLTARS